MASKPDNSERTSINLGDEFDDTLRSKLFEVLLELGASNNILNERFLAGSQDFEKIAVLVNKQLLNIEAETYIGLTIEGPADLVREVQLKICS